MQSKPHWIVRLLYNNNPFYLISGLIVLFALHSNSPNAVSAEHSSEVVWTQCLQLAGWMAGYSVLMAITAICVVRRAKIWEDARTIYLVVVLSTLGMSVVFDQLSVQSNSSAAVLLICGLVFSIFLVEFTLRISKLELPFVFRLPTYLLYVAFFVSPILLASELPWIQQLEDLKVVMFPAITSLIFLTLLPAIRRGRQVSENNGSPWIWPYYPWSLIIILFVAVLFRSSALAVSFGPLEDSSLIINPFFLLPLGMVVLIVLMEIAIVENINGLRNGVLTFTPALLSFGVLGSLMPFQASLIADIETSVAPTILISGWCLALIYVHYFSRGIVGCRIAASVTLAILSIPTSESGLFGGSSVALAALAALPFLVELSAAITKRKSQQEWITSGLFFGFSAGTLANIQMGVVDSVMIGGATTIVWCLIIGLIFESEFMALVRGCCAIVLGLVTSIIGWFACFEGQAPFAACIASWILFAVTFAYFLLNRRMGWKRLIHFCGLVTIVVQLNVFKDFFMPLLDSQNSLAILGGLLCFAIGVLITSVKAGALTKLRERWRRPTPNLAPGF